MPNSIQLLPLNYNDWLNFLGKETIQFTAKKHGYNFHLLSISNGHQWNFSQLKQLASKFKNND